MNSPQDPRKDPLQDDEVALARVLRALPGGEPSPRVDAAILAAARNATAGSPAKAHRRRGLPGWALGTAAAAVLAVGIGLQLQPARDALPEGATAEAPVSASNAEVDLEQIEVTGSRLKRTGTEEAEFAAPPAQPQEPSPRRLPAPPPPPPVAVPRAPPRAAAAEPLRKPEAVAAQSLADSARSLESSAPAERAENRQREARRAPVPVAESAPVRASDEAAGAPLPSAFSADDVLPPVDEDSRLAPEDWLERIRERIRQGDRAGARASLQRFERTHPDIAVPDDLAAFRP